MTVETLNDLKKLFEHLSEEKKVIVQSGQAVSIEKAKEIVAIDAKIRSLFKTVGYKFPDLNFDNVHSGVHQILDQHHDVTGQLIKKLESEINTKELSDYAQQIQEIEDAKNEILAVENSTTLALSPPEQDLIQNKVNELRKAIREDKKLTDEHRRRLVEKTNQLQTELNREVGNYYHVLGRLVDLGDALGAFGTKSKPLTDRLKDVASSVKQIRSKNLRIGKDNDPLQIPDMSDEESTDE